jgi:hypothetical protein
MRHTTDCGHAVAFGCYKAAASRDRCAHLLAEIEPVAVKEGVKL